MNALPEVITTFLSYKRVIQNCSQGTVLEYRRDLCMFFRHILSSRRGVSFDQNADISAVDAAFLGGVKTEEIYAFLLYLSETRKVASRTVARRLSAVKAFFRYHTAKSKLLGENPAKDIDSPRIRPGLPKYLTLGEAIKLLSSLDSASPHYSRDYCILTLFLNCGMRLAELVGIDLTHIDADFKTVRVTGKGGKMRIIPLNDACRAAISDYIPQRNALSAKCKTPLRLSDKNALFLSRQNKRISPKTVQWLVIRHLSAADLGGKGYSTHKLRHTAATLMYAEGGVDVRTLKDILGHEQLNTTQIYTHVSDKNLKEAVDANPLADIRKP